MANPIYYPILAISFAMFFIPFVMYLGNMESDDVIKLKVHHLDKRDFFNTVPFPPQEGVEEEEDVVWAVFFHKPYCSACRRIKPAFVGMGRTTNSTGHLRFAAVDCVKNKQICSYESVPKQPAVVLYKGFYEDGYYKREQVATWRGMLIAYELLAWFQQQQHQGLISEEVEWPDLDRLGEAMLAYKTNEHSKIAIPAIVDETISAESRMGYLAAAEASMRMSLTDHVFPDGKKKRLTGNRMRAMGDYLQALQHTFPLQRTRGEIETLLDSLKGYGSIVTEEQWDQALELSNLSAPVVDMSYNNTWCQTVEGGDGAIGGYPCGLWVLFHSMLANADRFSASPTLKAIHGWVKNFFGCDACAKHFMQMYRDLDGNSQEGHIDPVLWMWEAHNRVRARLSHDDTVLRVKPQWPARENCDNCFNEEIREGMMVFDDTGKDGFQTEAWSPSHIFDYAQEIYCYGSESFSCAQFYDPTHGVEPDQTGRYFLIGGIALIVVFGIIAFYYMKQALDSDFKKQEEAMLAESQRLQEMMHDSQDQEVLEESQDEEPQDEEDEPEEQKGSAGGLKRRGEKQDEDEEEPASDHGHEDEKTSKKKKKKKKKKKHVD